MTTISSSRDILHYYYITILYR